ncbi:hypothetical protein SAMN05421640_1179 [Ekhidna lutea]|uniref:Uncharacterized protein n=1 Tax=Ekhidna lutea TaxID=447679 RepID=A0A239H7I0_EKHLU|nr:hypothetical protein SAMN05421640_1179 [Ekhidna lutea]
MVKKKRKLTGPYKYGGREFDTTRVGPIQTAKPFSFEITY